MGVQAARQIGQAGFGTAAAPGRTDRRDVLRPLADLEDQYAWPRRGLHVHRLHARRLSKHGLVGLLRSRQRESESAGLRRYPRSARRAAAGTDELEQWFSAR